MSRKNHHRDSCYYCERPFTFKDFGKRNAVIKTVDHIIPESKGGADKYINTVFSCAHCNYLKDNLTLDQFLSKVEGLIQEGYLPDVFPRINVSKIVEKIKQLKQYIERQGSKLYKSPGPEFEKIPLNPYSIH